MTWHTFIDRCGESFVIYGDPSWPSACYWIVQTDDRAPEGTCPRCWSECWREEVDVGVGVIYGPWGCSACGWSESEEYDLSGGRDPVDERGGVTDQFGVYYPPGNSVALAYRAARKMSSGSEN